MNKEDIVGQLSLSCVENYFLGYFQGCFDIRFLYAESFAGFAAVCDDFLCRSVRYENYPLKRLQTTAEELGLTCHGLEKEFRLEENSLNLIRVNEAFFSGSKRFPWRPDHYIAVEKSPDGYCYLNNYPLSCGLMTEERLKQVYGGACLSFRQQNEFNADLYEKRCDLQYERIVSQRVKELRIVPERLSCIRDALLVLKILRRRTFAWLEMQSDAKRFRGDGDFCMQANELTRCYDLLLAAVQLQLVRKDTDVSGLQEKLEQLCQMERLLAQSVEKRRR